MPVDAETDKIIIVNKELFDLVNHAGWKHARLMIVEKIQELQTVAEYMDTIQTGNATKLLREMKANSRAAEILFDWLRSIEGGANEAIDQLETKDKSYIVRV